MHLIDATSLWAPMRKSLGDKRREIPPDKAAEIVAIHRGFAEGERSKIFPTTHFGYRKITVERPLRLAFQAGAECIARLDDEPAFRGLAASKKKDASARAKEEAEGRREQQAIRDLLAKLPQDPCKDREEFRKRLREGAKSSAVKIAAPIERAILAAFSERDAVAEICRDQDGNPEPDPELRDTENVPLSETVEAYFDREVKPHVSDAWIDAARRDAKDGQVGVVGYEINFNRYFYRYQPPRPLEEIEADIRAIETDIVRMLAEVTGSGLKDSAK